MSLLSYHAEAFGQRWRSDLPLSGFDACSGDLPKGMTPIDVHLISELPDRRGGRVVNRGWVYDDGLRFPWEDEVVFDMIDGDRIGYRPGPRWTGALPASFYGTVAALTLAWRGVVPFHACAVELDGKAVLIAGPTGAGKSTLTVGLVAAGGCFVADDLVGASIDARGRITIGRGRPTIRLHRDGAARTDMIRAEPVMGDSRGKWIAWPRRRSALRELDLATVIILDDRPGEISDQIAGDQIAGVRIAGVRLLNHLFRPGWLNALPMQAELMRKALTIATTVSVMDYQSLSTFDCTVQKSRADGVIARYAQISMRRT